MNRPVLRILGFALSMLDQDDKDDLIDAVEKRLHEKEKAAPKARRRVVIRAIEALRGMINVPDEEGEDQLNPV